MAREGLTGSRIRERRQIARLRQADLAKNIGISASYLNLIEHNRRRIGGKLLLRIAEVLGVDAVSLTEGAEAALVGALREAEADASVDSVELDRIEEFAGRFPGWAGLLAATQRRARQLERTVEELNDRLAHDPALAASVHEVLSTAASIHSTASILAETDALEREWLDRFHTNINEDSMRLAESSRALAEYLEQGKNRAQGPSSPQDEVDQFLTARTHHIAELEQGDTSNEDIVRNANLGPQARDILGQILHVYRRDVAALPMDQLRNALDAQDEFDLITLARSLQAAVPLTMRRLAALPDFGAGYVLCDRSGTLLLRKDIAGFSIPRYGANCPLWPVFQALAQPGTLIQSRIEQLGRRQAQFDCFAMSEPVGAPMYNMPPLAWSGMLIVPSKLQNATPLQVGSSCRVCPKAQCAGRREPSVLEDA